MNAYVSMACVDPLSPLVLVTGLGGDEELPKASMPLRELDFGESIDDTLAKVLRKDIDKRNHRPGPWEPSRAIPGVHWLISQKPSVYQKEKPSPIAASGSEIIGNEWLLKYVWFCPCAIVIFANMSKKASEMIEKHRDIAESIGAVLVVVFAVDAGDEHIIAELEKQKEFIKTPLLTIAKKPSSTATSSLVQNLERIALGIARDYYVAKARQVRTKRNNSTPNVIAEARSTFKLACFSELACDPGVLKLLDSAYSSIQLLFDNDLVVPEDIQGWNSARTMLDICMLKILQHTLVVDEKAARLKFDSHLVAISHIQQKNRLSASPSWIAEQFWSYAELCRAAAIPSGLLYLESACLWVKRQLKSENDGIRLDPYSPHKEDTEQAFFNAISQLSGSPNSKARALTLYGDWLSPNDSKSACEAYKGALYSLKLPWPLIEEYLARRMSETAEGTDKLLAQLLLFRIGDSDLPTEGKVSEMNMYRAFGTWECGQTYLGRLLKFQLQLKGPKLLLESVSLRTTTGYHTIENVQAPGNIEFDVPVREIGALAAFEITIEHSRFTQKSVPLPSREWISTFIRHPRIENPLITEAGTRPSALGISPKFSSSVAPEEKFRAVFILQNDEDCQIIVSARIFLGDRLVSEQKVEIDAGSAYTLTADIDAPQTPFALRLLAEYTVDGLPVEAQATCSLEIVRPFRVTFDLLPEFDNRRWPSPFIPADQSLEIPRRWRLGASILSLTSAHLKQARIVLDSKNKIEKQSEWEKIERTLVHNDVAKSDHVFVTYSLSRSVDATAALEIEWCRKDTDDLVNKMLIPSVRLSVPTQEPRVLAMMIEGGVEYWIENGTAHTLTFAVSMASSSKFAFQGYKAASVRLLPVSRQCFKYQLVPLTENDAHVRGKRPLPEFRAFDTHYKRALAVLPGDRNIKLDQGSLLV